MRGVQIWEDSGTAWLPCSEPHSRLSFRSRPKARIEDPDCVINDLDRFVDRLINNYLRDFKIGDGAVIASRNVIQSFTEPRYLFVVFGMNRVSLVICHEHSKFCKVGFKAEPGCWDLIECRRLLTVVLQP